MCGVPKLAARTLQQPPNRPPCCAVPNPQTALNLAPTPDAKAGRKPSPQGAPTQNLMQPSDGLPLDAEAVTAAAPKIVPCTTCALLKGIRDSDTDLQCRLTLDADAGRKDDGGRAAAVAGDADGGHAGGVPEVKEELSQGAGGARSKQIRSDHTSPDKNVDRRHACPRSKRGCQTAGHD